MRVATVLSESGTEGSGGAVEEVEDAMVVVVVGDPARPTEALVAPPLVSQGFGGDGEDMRALVPARRAGMRVVFVLARWRQRWGRYEFGGFGRGPVQGVVVWRGTFFVVAKVRRGRQECSGGMMT